MNTEISSSELASLPAENNPAFLLDLYKSMFRIRRFEEKLLSLFSEGRLRGTTHVCIGQEAVAAGACTALENSDKVFSNHRGHGHMLAKGADMFRMFAELFGRKSGYSRGIGGSQHMAAKEAGFYGSNGITAGGLPVATGCAFSQKYLSQKNVTLAFFGDGASAQGAFHEAFNLASVWKLPLVFVCENNGYAMGTTVDQTCPKGNLKLRGFGYGAPVYACDGTDPLSVFRAASHARKTALESSQPVLIVADTIRLTGHSRSDKRTYISEEIIAEERARDPLPRFRENILKKGIAEAEIVALETKVEEEINSCSQKAAADEVLSEAEFSAILESQCSATDSNSTAKSNGSKFSSAGPTCADAAYQALHDSLEENDKVFLLGEDIADYRGSFKVTRDLFENFGCERVHNTPISENTIVGCAVGAAMCGLRPVAEIMFMDFLLLALDQLCNHAAKFPLIYGGQFEIPLTLRTPAGGRRGYGATHSQCFESILMSMPGLQIYCPANALDSYHLLRQAISEDSPVVVVEHKLLYGMKDSYVCADTESVLPAGKARVIRKGTDLTIITFSHMTLLAMQAAEFLETQGVSAEVIDLRTLRPLDTETICESASRTGRVIIAEEGPLTGGVGAEISSMLQEACFGYLDAPVLRVAARDCPIPTCESLENYVLPQAQDIVNAAARLLQD